ncbi:hypothetical protein [Pseudofrankia sp. DC12]|uniref:hypothetical protein n=1 Tax=Pseudofrankia sp. DC12 TaxID=683315 RepID=UPI0005F824F4|nr:hypothetical protein [Pseudofrankia sp. DC12]
MTIGSSIFMIVVGAILRYAITWRVQGLNLPALGLILAIAGIVTLVLRLIWLFNPGLGERAPRPPAWLPDELGDWTANPANTPPPAAPRPATTGPDAWRPGGFRQ